MHSVSCFYDKLLLYCLDLLRSVEHTDSKLANNERALLQWAHSAKLSVVVITNCQCFKLQNFRLYCTMLKYDVSRRLKFQVQVVRQQLQLQSKFYASSYRRNWNYIMWFVIYYYKFPIALYKSSRNQLKVTSAHHEIFLILLRNASRDLLMCICLLNFHDNRAPYFIPLC